MGSVDQTTGESPGGESCAGAAITGDDTCRNSDGACCQVSERGFGVEMGEPCNQGRRTYYCSQNPPCPMTSPRDFGTGVKWDRIYAVASTFPLFLFFPHHSPPPSSRPPIFFLDSTADGEFYYSNLHRVLMDHTCTKTCMVCTPGWLYREFFFLFFILFFYLQTLQCSPTLQWGLDPSTAPRCVVAQLHPSCSAPMRPQQHRAARHSQSLKLLLAATLPDKPPLTNMHPVHPATNILPRCPQINPLIRIGYLSSFFP